ncbi:MAG: PAS domain S-box protein [Bacteroidetes bacterium]|nr:MAG: PAS domain S-box protein [Bacteroidota bacterium]TAG88917.1 MAG: PAS domain S-box protein [Bacteroidota bacterium]
MWKFNFSTIQTRVRLFFILNIVLVIFNYFYLNYYDNKLKQDQSHVEVSRENEKYLEKFEYLTRLIVVGGEIELKKVLQQDLKTYTDNIQALKNGGTAIVGTETPNITEAYQGKKELRSLESSLNELSLYLKIIIDKKITIEAKETAPKVEPQKDSTKKITEPKKEIKDSTKVKKDTTKLPKKEEKNIPKKQTETNTDTKIPPVFSFYKNINPEVEKAFYSARTSIEDVLDRNRQLSTVYQDNSEDTQSFLGTVILLTFSLNLLVLLVGTFVIGTYLINPLRDISATAKQVASGDINTKIEYKRDDEIGEVADSLNLIVGSFKEYAVFAESIGKGDFDVPFQVKSQQDTLGLALQRMRDNLARIDDEDNKRNWINEGFAQFGTILRATEQDFNEFSYQIISNLVKYVEANQGGIFLLSKDENLEEYLELKAGFAYNKRKYEQKIIKAGQGLLGQVILERDIIYMEDVPNEYIQITSGLGKANPRCLLISPLQVNNEIFGAIEIASFQPIERYKIDFIQQLSENIASTIATVRTNENTKRLLEESRLQAEKMKATEDMMRMNVEQLADTQEQMQRDRQQLEEYKNNLEKEVESRTGVIQKQEKALEDALNQLQGIIDSSRAGIVALNKSFEIVAANRQIKEVIKSIRGTEFELGDMWLDTFNEKDEKRTRAKTFWERAFSGIYFNHEESYILEGNLKRWLEFSYSPILNDDKEIMGASMFVRDITDRKRELKNIELNAYILDNSSSEVYVFDANTMLFLMTNERARQNIGYPTEEIVNKMYAYEIEPETLPEIFVARLLPLKDKTLKFQNFETNYKRKNGTKYTAEVSLQYFEDEEKPLIAAIVQDITQRKQNELKLTEAINRFDLATQATKEGLWEMNVVAKDPINPDNPAWWSSRFKELLDYDENDNFPEKLDAWSGKLHPEDRDKVMKALYEHLVDKTGQVPFDTEFRILNRKGEYLWFSSTAETQRDEAGTPMKIAGSIRNINRRKKAEEELKEQTAIVNAILQASVNGILSINPEGKILSANPAANQMFGGRRENLVGQDIYQFFVDKDLNWEDLADTLCVMECTSKTGRNFRCELSTSRAQIEEKRFYALDFRILAHKS